MAPVAGYTAVLNPFSFTLTGDSISSANMLVAAGYSIDGGITYTGFALSKNGTPITPNPDSLGTPIATADIITFSAPAISLPANASLNFRIIYWKNASGATSGNRVILSPINITGSTTPVASCTVNNWTGAVSTAWEDAGNWSCGTVPTAVSEVHVNSGLTNYPIVNSSATCKKLYTSPGASVTITTGFTLDIVGHN